MIFLFFANILDWFFCYDKTLTKMNIYWKGFICIIAVNHNKKSRQALRKCTGRSCGEKMLTGLFPMDGSAWFLTSLRTIWTEMESHTVSLKSLIIHQESIKKMTHSRYAFQQTSLKAFSHLRFYPDGYF